MKGLIPYLSFNGNCKEAMTFYKDIFKTDTFNMMTFKDAQHDCPEKFPADLNDQIMHAEIKAGDFWLMASDCPPEHKANFGNNVSLNIQADSLEHQEELFNKLAEGGMIIMPLGDAFWGSRFGMLVDKFGTNWMFNHELEKQS